MKSLNWTEIERLRHTPNKTALLYLTDRCPVGCLHCSVNARVDSARPKNWRLFQEMVDALISLPDIETIGITGGEPFVERPHLTYALEQLSQRDKLPVRNWLGTHYN